ncbi:MAG: hypothetical protein AVDCRST_MAG12-3017, partial [uncultured Rubrobacteraceae bacterium]
CTWLATTSSPPRDGGGAGSGSSFPTRRACSWATAPWSCAPRSRGTPARGSRRRRRGSAGRLRRRSVWPIRYGSSTGPLRPPTVGRRPTTSWCSPVSVNRSGSPSTGRASRSWLAVGC